MGSINLNKAAILTVILIIIFFASWELYLRSKGFSIDYDDGGPLWADKRAMVYEPSSKATVFIGASRNKYDIDIKTWQNITNDHAIQLAAEASSPLPVLNDLANDKKFKGKLIIDITEPIFFSTLSKYTEEPENYIIYYKKITPSEKFSFLVNRVLESQFVFLDKNNFSLQALLSKILSGRWNQSFEEVISRGRITFDRQNVMMDKFVTDTNLHNMIINKAKYFWSIDSSKISEPQVDSILLLVKNCVDKIRSRGGEVMFVRTPSSGDGLQREKEHFPKEKYWDRILAVTGCPGIYFEDYPAIAHFQCPEFSHLKPSDAIIYTKNLIQILQQKGWKFPYKQTNENL